MAAPFCPPARPGSFGARAGDARAEGRARHLQLQRGDRRARRAGAGGCGRDPAPRADRRRAHLRGLPAPISRLRSRASRPHGLPRPARGRRAAPGDDGGSLLTQAGAARRLQDPLSLRCVSQVHGALIAALGFARGALDPEINGAGDNPLIAEDDAILSTGNFHHRARACAGYPRHRAGAGGRPLGGARSVCFPDKLTELPANLIAGDGAVPASRRSPRRAKR